MRETKRQMSLYSFYDHTGIERHLTRMAERGWLLCKIGQFFWHYRRIEPKKLSFCVCYFPQATIYDPGPSEGQEEFYEFCAHAGWTLAGASGQLQVFYNERANPVPIDTAPELEVEAIHQSAKKSFLLSNFLLLGVGVLNLCQFLWRLFDDPIATLSSALALFSLVCWPVLILMEGVDIITYFRWRRRALAAAEQGEFLATKSHPVFQTLGLAVVLTGFAWCLSYLQDGLGGAMAVAMVGTAGLIAAVLGIRQLLKGARVSAQTNRRGTLAACVVLSILFAAAIPWFVVRSLGSRPEPKSGDLPLTVGDLLEADIDYNRTLIYSESPVLASLEVRQSPWRHGEMKDAPRLDYGVTVVKAPFLYGTCKSHVLGWWDRPGENWIPQSRTDPVDPAPWGAEEAYQVVYLKSGPQDKYVLCYPDRIVEIGLDWTPTPEQMAVIGGKLGRGPL